MIEMFLIFSSLMFILLSSTISIVLPIQQLLIKLLSGVQKRNPGIVRPSGGHWLLGHFFPVLKYTRMGAMHELLMSFSKECGSVCEFNFLFSLPSVVITDVQLMRSIFRDVDKFTRNDSIIEAASPVCKGLAFLNGNEWRERRKIAVHAFYPDHLRRAQTHINLLSKKLIERLPTEKYLNAQRLLSAFTMDVFMESMVSIPFDFVQEILHQNVTKSSSIDMHKFTGYPAGFSIFEDVDTITKAIFKRIGLPKDFWFLFMSDNETMMSTTSRMKAFLMNIVETKMNSNSELKEKGEMDLLDLILANRIGMSTDKVVDDVLVLLIAGFESTANSLTMALYELANNPIIQEKARAECFKHDNNEDVEYLELIVKETLRVHPPLPFSVRKCQQDVEIEGYSFMKGTNLVMSILGVHYDERYWKNPTVFHPERFNEPIVLNSFMPFISGPQSCLGQKYALIEMKTCLFHLLRNFKWTVEEGQGLDKILFITLGLKNGCRMKFEKL